MLDVCLGAQLLSVVAGGRVETARQPEIGIHDVHEEYLLGIWPDVTTRWFDVVTATRAREQTSGNSG